ncbi:MAG: CHAT domain-containing protein [Chloroflexota bacterium]|nr:CHAT domain-containing protein [Chloroflexota bacterium]MDQ5867537.1 CHAT domain-containing protein [Chloroflexota bacterium]
MSSGGSSLATQGPVLRLTQTSEQDGSHRVELALDAPGQPRNTATSRFPFELTEQEREDLRWYLEDYLEHPVDPAPKIAKRVEQWIEAKGEELFNKLFQANDDSRFLWASIRQRLPETRIEVSSGVHEAAAIPWELLRDPRIKTLLALRSGAFVRTYSNPVLPPQLPASTAGPIRILLVICRPGKGQDVPFRSVASRIVKSLTEEARAQYTLDVLRPPTYEHLRQTLRRARDAGEPYHVVHFDGHGAFLDVPQLFKNWQETTQEEQEMLKRTLDELGLGGFDPLRFSPELVYPRRPREGQRGYLLFENPQSIYNIRLVDGPEMGALLTETQVPVLVLNACRSAHAEAPTTPKQVSEGADQAANLADDHARVRAYGSFAQEVADAGVAGVVAMRYNVYVVTAAQFVADLYTSLIRGYTLGEAVRTGRSQLHDNPVREIAYAPIPLQDWSVPVIYEAAPIALFPKRQGEGDIKIDIREVGGTPSRGDLDPQLPKRPDAGFYGRDESLLALDRAFDNHHVVLLHAYAGSGKTTTAAEFARWYSLTGGVRGPVLFTSFEQPFSLARTLDTFGRVFGPTLERSNIPWLALDNGQRREVALSVMNQVPIFWIWDNVEPVAGFPAGTPSILSTEQQQELVDFLRDAHSTQAKFLITSRRDEQVWLGNLPVRVRIPPMPMLERLELAKALASKYGSRLADVENWRPLLRYTQGNPLTITIVVGQALRDGLSTKAQIEAYLARLQAGESAFEEEESEGRTKSLGASLSYGFYHAFSDEERAQLALLHLFQGFIYVEVLRVMGDAEKAWSVPTVRGLTREVGIDLLDRAAEVGLLTVLGGGYYAIHPALPWYFKSLFDHYYGDDPSLPTRAFSEAMGRLADFYHNQYSTGNTDVFRAVSYEEGNILYTRELARINGWWGLVISAMQGLDVLYRYTGRNAEWKRLVDEIVPDFVDPTTGGPLAGREKDWNFFSMYHVGVAVDSRQWAEAERLQGINVEWNRKLATPLLEMPPGVLDATQRNTIRTLAASLIQLGIVLLHQGKSECVHALEEGYNLEIHIDDHAGAGVAAHNLSRAYKDVPGIRDLDQAELWSNRSLQLHDERDTYSRGASYGSLGIINYERFVEARKARRPNEELLLYLNVALQYNMQTLAVLPPWAIEGIAVAHNGLGNIYEAVNDLNKALMHWREAIQYKEASGNIYDVANIQENVTVALARRGRFEEALVYGQAMLRNFQNLGPGAIDYVRKAQRLIAEIERLMAADTPNPTE